MWSPAKSPINNPLMPWSEAINQPGAAQMQHGRALMESRPFLTRVPDDSVIVTDRVATSVPGTGARHFAATRDESGSYAMVYAPVGRAFKVRMDKITGAKVKAWWFNPRDGSAKELGPFDRDRGAVLDDATEAQFVAGELAVGVILHHEAVVLAQAVGQRAGRGRGLE